MTLLQEWYLDIVNGEKFISRRRAEQKAAEGLSQADPKALSLDYRWQNQIVIKIIIYNIIIMYPIIYIYYIYYHYIYKTCS